MTVKPSCDTQYSIMPMLELEELARAVGGLTEPDDAGLVDARAQGLEVLEIAAGLGGRERNRIGLEPGDHRFAGFESP